MADLLTHQITPLPTIPLAWLPFYTFDTVEYIHPDTLKGHICIERLEAVELNEEEICVAAKLAFPTLIDNAHDDDSEYDIFDGLLYSMQEPTKFAPTILGLYYPPKLDHKSYIVAMKM